MCFLDGASPASPSLIAQWRHVVDKGPPDVMVARNGAWSTVHNWGLRELADDVGLVVGELGTNAWTQGRPPIVLTLRLEAGCLTIEVSDTGPGMPMFSNPGLLGLQGRGLPAAAAVADEVGIVADARGTTVWARLRFRLAEPAESDPGAAAA
jgi:hypothetical protein